MHKQKNQVIEGKKIVWTGKYFKAMIASKKKNNKKLCVCVSARICVFYIIYLYVVIAQMYCYEFMNFAATKHGQTFLFTMQVKCAVRYGMF